MMIMFFFARPTLSVTELSCHRRVRMYRLLGRCLGFSCGSHTPNRLLGHRDGAQGLRATHRHMSRFTALAVCSALRRSSGALTFLARCGACACLASTKSCKGHLLDLIGSAVFNITVRVFHAVETVVAHLSLFYLLHFSIVDDSVEHPLNGGPAQRVGDLVFLGKIDQVLLIAKR